MFDWGKRQYLLNNRKSLLMDALLLLMVMVINTSVSTSFLICTHNHLSAAVIICVYVTLHPTNPLPFQCRPSYCNSFKSSWMHSLSDSWYGLYRCLPKASVCIFIIVECSIGHSKNLMHLCWWSKRYVSNWLRFNVFQVYWYAATCKIYPI